MKALPIIYCFILLSIFSIKAYAQNTISIIVNGIASSNGNIMIGVYDNAEQFPDYENAILGKVIPSKDGSIQCEFPNLSDGKYAIAVWHDENSNQKLDTNWVGIPKEKYGFSNNVFGKFGPPDFEDVMFLIHNNETKKLTINLK